MSFKRELKTNLMLSVMNQQRSKPFDVVQADLFTLPADAGNDINNSWFFGADSMDGRSFKMRLGIRNNGQAEVFLIYIDPDGRYLTSEKQLYPIDESPMQVSNLIPARDWHVSYDGWLVDMNDAHKVHCEMQFDFIARLPIFYPLKDAYLKGMAMAFAVPKWNKTFFKHLSGDTGVSKEDKKYKQIHYEQTGRMKGSIVLDGQCIEFDMAGIRDRAWGMRNWDYMDCHMWLVAVTERGEAMNLSIVSYPHAKNLHCGYTDMDSDRNYALTDYRIISYDHCGGKGPDDMSIALAFANGRFYRMDAHRTHDLITSFGDGKFYFHEAVGCFTFTEIASLDAEPVAGARCIKARGTIELGWNIDSSRWGDYKLI